jgi:cytochrome c-type biogenesis protein CcmH/NrfG
VTGTDTHADRAALEEERDFLLRSLDDLELEHEAGGIDDESYRQLRDDYTARAAAVIRALRDGVDTRPARAAPVSMRRRLLVIGGVTAFAVAAGLALAAALGARLPGQTASGNSQSAASARARASLAKRITSLQQQVNANPNDYQLRMDLATAYEQNGDATNALKQSDAAIGIDPNRPEAHANAARLLFLASEQVPTKDAQDQLIAEAKAGFDRAISVGPDYADSYYYRAVLLITIQDLASAQADLQRYLVKAPNGRWADNARSLLARVTQALQAPATTPSPATTRPPTATTKKPTSK